MSELPAGLPPLPYGWVYETLGQVVDRGGGLSYGIVQPGAHSAGGVPVLRVKDIRGRAIDVTDPLLVNPEIDKQYQRTRLRGGEVLLTLVGSVGETTVTTTEVEGWNVARAIAVIRPPEDVSPSWLEMCLSSGLAQAFMEMWMTTTVQATLNLRDVRTLPVVLPPPSERQALDATLSGLQAKVTSNRRTIRLIDELVRAQLEALSLNVPGTPSDSMLVSQMVERVHEPVSPTAIDPETPYIGLEHVPRGQIVIDQWGRAGTASSTKSVVRTGDILFGKLRPYFRKVAVSPVGGICSTDILVLRPRSAELTSFALAVLASDAVIDYASAASAGTRMPRVSWDYLASWSQSIPSVDGALAMARELSPMIDLALKLVQENRSLTALRDALLPELLSGRLRVREAEELVSDV